ncbi:MAG: N-acetylmuramic acid 6-phosphate etherase [Planctomycetota bacterium]|nr:N-acetylmuramic acid 6-phosphate etherase [Planctomycetota bacterium]
MNWVTEGDHAAAKSLDLLSSRDFAKVMAQANFEVARAVEKATDQIAQGIDFAAQALEAGGSLYLIGAGTSGRLAVLEAAECPPTFHTPHTMVQALLAGGPAAMTAAIEGAEDNEDMGREAVAHLTSKDLLIGISASGRAPFARAALTDAKERGIKTLLVTSQPGHEALVDLVILLETGPEVLSGSTRMKAATAAKCALNAISTGAMAKMGRIYGNLMVEVRPTNNKLRGRAASLIQRLAEVSEARSFELLDACDGDVKLAIASTKLGLDLEKTRQKLEACGRRLREIL